MYDCAAKDRAPCILDKEEDWGHSNKPTYALQFNIYRHGTENVYLGREFNHVFNQKEGQETVYISAKYECITKVITKIRVAKPRKCII